jgi:HlyD family secretion protein
MIVTGCDVPLLSRAGGAQTAPAAPAAQPTLAAVTTTTQSRPEVTVRRGTITDSIKVLGRVISSQEADLYFKTTNRLRGIFTESGQQVKAGDVLAELETGTLTTQLAKAKADLENAQLKLDQARAKSVLDSTGVDEQAVQTASINLDQARVQLDKLRAGPLDADVKTAESAVVQARANLEKARSDLAAKEADLQAKQAELSLRQAGATPADLAAAQAAVDTARIKLQQATAGARPEDVQTAEVKLEQTRTKLAQLRDTPPAKPEDIANAEIDLQKAQINLDKVRADTAGTPAQREAAVRTAELAVQTAQNDLNAKKGQQASPWDLRLAEQAVAAAENDLAKVKNPLPYDAQTAKVNYDAAVAKLEQLQRGPTEQDLASLKNTIASTQIAVESARAAIPSAEAALAAAEASSAAKTGGATEFDVRDAQNKVDLAQVALDQAQGKLDVSRSTLGVNRTSTAYDVQLLEKQVEKAQLDVAQLQSNLDDARIIAPFDGKITKVNGKPGDNVSAFSPVISISSPAQLMIQSQIQEADMPKLAVGQWALVTLDVFPGQVINGTVRDLPSSVVTQQGVVADKNTKIAVEWMRPGAEIGMQARVQIVVQKKDDVLIVPTSAIRTVGKRRFVEYLDGNVKRSRNVETGISTDVDTEILSGLDEGMTILAAS